MNTKEAIKWLKDAEKAAELKKWRIDNIITLLQRGSAFEKMFREVENMYGSSLTWDIEQKYFPKPSANFTKKVMDKINKKGER